MKNKPFECPKCRKRFTTDHGAQMHIDMAHGGDGVARKVVARKRKKPPRPEREMSMADIAVEAELKVLMGDDLDPLEQSLYDSNH